MTEENKKIVFVLGAGSSMSLSKEKSANKMPSGRDLVEKISEYKLKATLMYPMYQRMGNCVIELSDNTRLNICDILDFIIEDMFWGYEKKDIPEDIFLKHEKKNINKILVGSSNDLQSICKNIKTNIDLCSFYNFCINIILNNRSIDGDKTVISIANSWKNYVASDNKAILMWEKFIGNRKDDINGKIDYKYEDASPYYGANRELLNIKIAASVVEKYKPSSIDYFMTNLKDVASMEFLDIIEYDEKILARTKLIQEYTKLIINDILIKAQNEIIGDNKGIHNKRNYMFDIRDTILKKSTYHNQNHKQNFIEYAMENVEVLNFNYDTTFDVLFTDRIPNFSNIKHIYGTITDDTDFDLFRYIVNRKDITGITKELKWINEDDDKKQKIKEIISEDDDDDKKNEIKKIISEIKKIISNANDIYFLGFGFDETNLLNIGFDKNNNAKKVFISNVNGRIINIIENLFDLERGIPIAKDNEFSLIMNHKIKTSGGGSGGILGTQSITSERDKEQTFLYHQKDLMGVLMIFKLYKFKKIDISRANFKTQSQG